MHYYLTDPPVAVSTCERFTIIKLDQHSTRYAFWMSSLSGKEHQKVSMRVLKTTGSRSKHVRHNFDTFCNWWFQQTLRQSEFFTLHNLHEPVLNQNINYITEHLSLHKILFLFDGKGILSGQLGLFRFIRYIRFINLLFRAAGIWNCFNSDWMPAYRCCNEFCFDLRLPVSAYMYV